MGLYGGVGGCMDCRVMYGTVWGCWVLYVVV